MIGLKNVASLAGKAAKLAAEKAELVQIDTVTLPRLHHEIGKWIVQHPKLPADLSQRRDELRTLEAQHDQASAPSASSTAVGVSGKAKQLAAQAGQAAASAALAAKIRSAYTSLGHDAWKKYGDKVVPKQSAEEFKSVMARRNVLTQVATPTAANPQPKSASVTTKARTSPASRKAPPRKLGRLLRIAAVMLGLGVTVAGAYGAWSYVSGGAGRSSGSARDHEVAATAKKSSPASRDSRPAAQPAGAALFLSEAHQAATPLMFPKSLPAVAPNASTSRTVVLSNGNVLTAFDRGNTEVECVTRTVDGTEVAREKVSGSLNSIPSSPALKACGNGTAVLAVRRGEKYACVMLGPQGKVAWETEPLSAVYAIAPLGTDGLLASANLADRPESPGGANAWAALYRWNSRGERSWGHEGGGPFLGSVEKNVIEVFDRSGPPLMVTTEGVTGVTVDGNGPHRSPRAAVSTNFEGKQLAFIPRLPGRQESGATRKHPMLRGVLRDGRLIAQDGYDKDELLIYGSDGKELVRKRLGGCVLALSCQGSDDAILLLIAGKDLRVTRLRPDGSEVWKVSFSESIPNPPTSALSSIMPETLLELPGGGILVTAGRYAVLIDSNGAIKACAEAAGAGETAGLANGSTIVWPSDDGACLVGDISAWPAS